MPAATEAPAPEIDPNLIRDLSGMLEAKKAELDTQTNLAATPKPKQDKINMTLEEMLIDCPIYFAGIDRSDVQALKIKFLEIQRDLLKGSLQLTQPYYDNAQRQTTQAEKNSQATENRLNHALKIIKKHNAAIALTGLGLLAAGVTVTGLFAYSYFPGIRSAVDDISGRVLQALHTPTPTLAVAPTELPPTLTPTPDLDPTLAYTTSPTNTPTISPTPEASGNGNGEPPKSNFNENKAIVSSATHWQVGLSENTLLCLDIDGNTFAKEVNHNPMQIDSQVIGCAIMKDGQIRTLKIDGATGNQLTIVVDDLGNMVIQIGTNTLTDLQTYGDWGWVGRQGFESKVGANVIDWVNNYLLKEKGNLWVQKNSDNPEKSGKVVMGE